MSVPTMETGLRIDSSFAQQLEGLYVSFTGDLAPDPQLVKLNLSLAQRLGLDVQGLGEDKIAALLSGGVTPLAGAPLAQAYAGHQFGGFSPKLGDGRALLLAEVVDRDGHRLDIHLKGSGRTVFSRGGDGKAVLGPVLREYILAEAMHKLNVPTTRALGVICTGEKIMRDRLLPGAVLARVASSHIRVGSFQFLAARGDTEALRKLADYSIERHYAPLKNSDNCYLALLQAVSDKQAQLVARWMSIGFVHGVMNTDNITICGETIDYGPCAFVEGFDPAAVFSSIDRQGRYAYSNQPSMALWGITRFAETLLPLIAEDEEQAIEMAVQVLDRFEGQYQREWLTLMRQKLGLHTAGEDDLALINDLLTLMAGDSVDFTLLFRSLSNVVRGDCAAALGLFAQVAEFELWCSRWERRLATEDVQMAPRVAAMDGVNPLYIPRNHLVEAVIEAAQQEGDFEPFERLMKVLDKPFEQRQSLDYFARAAPQEFGKYVTYCGT